MEWEMEKLSIIFFYGKQQVYILQKSHQNINNIENRHAQTLFLRSYITHRSMIILDM